MPDGLTLAPPYPAETRAKGWRLEIDHERIRQSDTWALATPEQRPWLLMLWMVAWEQSPCGSMPASHELIAARIGMPAKMFEKNHPILLRGWNAASDGRMYHQVLTERVLDMIGRREKTATRKADYRARMQESRESPEGVPRDSTGRDATGTGTGTGYTEAKASVAPKARASRKCPEGYEPDDAAEWIATNCQSLDWRRETAKFQDHTFKTALTDWRGAWRNWMRRAAEGGPKAPVYAINRQEAIEQRNRQVGEEWLRQQEAADASLRTV